MHKTGVAGLKSALAGYLELVKGGEEVLVTEGEIPVARIVPVAPADPAAAAEALLAGGVLLAPAAALDDAFWELRRPEDPDGALRAALAADREEGR